MSWLTYAIRSTIRTIFPSCVAGSCGPVCVRIPSRTSAVRFSRSAIRSDCSLCRKPRAEPVAERLVERLLARVPERRVARVVAEPDRLDEILVQPERTRDDPRDRRRLQRVGHPRPVVVALRVDEDLGLPLQPAKRLRVDEPVAVALERRSHAARLLGAEATLRLVRADGERRQPRLLALADRASSKSPRCAIDRLHRLQSSPRRGVRSVRRGAIAAPADVRTSGTGRRRP